MNRYQFEQKYKASQTAINVKQPAQQIALPLDMPHVSKLPAYQPAQSMPVGEFH